MGKGLKEPWWERVQSVDDIVAEQADPAAFDPKNQPNFVQLYTEYDHPRTPVFTVRLWAHTRDTHRCMAMRKSASTNLARLNKEHSAWIEGQLEWEKRRHDPVCCYATAHPQ